MGKVLSKQQPSNTNQQPTRKKLPKSTDISNTNKQKQSTNSTSYEAAINSRIFENDVNDVNDENNNDENEMMTKDTAPIIIINSGSPQRRREKENTIDSVSVNEININLKKSENCINSSENSTQITTNTVQSNEKDSVNTNKNSQIEQQHSQKNNKENKRSKRRNSSGTRSSNKERLIRSIFTRFSFRRERDSHTKKEKEKSNKSSSEASP